jgi:hypothetical protein
MKLDILAAHRDKTKQIRSVPRGDCSGAILLKATNAKLKKNIYIGVIEFKLKNK